jgi:ubiquinone/menaquinone biosynthesis C-methylase UbiE
LHRFWARHSARYDADIRLPERLLFQGGREWVCARAAGEVLEVAVGTGRNLPHYPPEVHITGIDLSPEMLQIARRRAGDLGRPIDLRTGNAESLEFRDGSFDTVVCTLALCTIPDPRAAVAEMRRVLRHGGRLLLLEHVKSPRLLVRAIEYALEPFACRLQCDHLMREPLDYLRAAAFEIEELERSRWGIVERVAARKP